jgi:hypothetical protein
LEELVVEDRELDESELRNDPMLAREIMENVCPAPAARQTVLRRLLDSIRSAEEHAPESWSVTLFGQGFRLNVGPVEAQTFFNGEVRLLLHGQGLKVQHGSVRPAAYKSVPQPQSVFHGTVDDLRHLPPQLVQAHDEFIRHAALDSHGRPRASRYPQKNSPGLIQYARQFVAEQSRRTEGGQFIGIAEMERLLKEAGYGVVHETDKKRAYKKGAGHPIYVNRKTKLGTSLVITHPESVAPQLRGQIEGVIVGDDYFHSSNLKLFPKRVRGGSNPIGYGWGVSFTSETAVVAFLDAMEGRPVSAGDANRGALIQGANVPVVSTARVGQDEFRLRLLDYWGACAVTGVREHLLLRASHIKPWVLSTPAEKTDVFNGLLLAPQFDAAFDAGLISFGDDGTLIASRRLGQADADTLGIRAGLRLRQVEPKHLPYLRFHRAQVFQDQ